MESNLKDKDAIEKTFWIIAGVNGAGKSTFIEWYNSDEDRLGRVINADSLALEYGSLIAGGRKAIEEINYCIKKGISFCQETTLSGNQVLKTIKKAKAHGFKVSIFYLGLDTVEEHILRVAKRVSEGGHDIPEEIIRHRFASRFECFCRVLPMCDTAILGTFDGFHDINALYYDDMLMDWNFNDRAWVKEFYQYFINHGGEMHDDVNIEKNNI